MSREVARSLFESVPEFDKRRRLRCCTAWKGGLLGPNEKAGAGIRSWRTKWASTTPSSARWDWWIGWIEEVPGVNSQGRTREELLENLQDALEEALEMNRADAAGGSRRHLRGSEHSSVKRHELLAHLRRHGCVLVREGRRHSWWGNPVNNQRSAVPRHIEIPDPLAGRSAAIWESGSRDDRVDHTSVAARDRRSACAARGRIIRKAALAATVQLCIRGSSSPSPMMRASSAANSFSRAWTASSLAYILASRT